MCEEEARVVQMRPVEKAAPGFSGPVGGSVSYVLGLEAVVFGDGALSYDVVGRYVSVCDVSVSCGGDMELCGVITVLSGAISAGLCNIDSVSGGGDTGVSGVDTVVLAANCGYMCDIDSVPRGDMIVSIDEMSLPGGCVAVVSCVDESVCGVNPVMSAGVLDLCGVGTVVSGVDSTGVDVVADAVACGDDILLPDAVRVGGWVVGCW